MSVQTTKTTAEALDLAMASRGGKPRSRGLTMVMDQGWPTNFVEGMLNDFGDFLDIAKLWDPHLLAPLSAVEKRVEAYRNAGVIVQPGGIWLELARAEGKGQKLLLDLQEIGFNGIEVSNTASTQSSESLELISIAKDLGYTVFGEVGQKFGEGDETRLTDEVIDVSRTIEHFQTQLAAGAWKCYWEGHLLRRVLGDTPTAIKERAYTGVSQVQAVVTEIGVDNIIFEASGLRPRANRQWLQFWLVHLFGPEVNIGNARIEELANLESIRSGTHPIFGFGNAGNYPWIRAIDGERADWWRQ
jgi:phosphosulfolactate synthase